MVLTSEVSYTVSNDNARSEDSILYQTTKVYSVYKGKGALYKQLLQNGKVGRYVGVYLQAICKIGDSQVLQNGGAIDVSQVFEGGHCSDVGARAGEHKQRRSRKAISRIGVGCSNDSLQGI